jgi:hypothetical protein
MAWWFLLGHNIKESILCKRRHPPTIRLSQNHSPLLVSLIMIQNTKQRRTEALLRRARHYSQDDWLSIFMSKGYLQHSTCQ